MPPELPSTPAGRQMAWVIDLLASGAMGLQPSEVEEHAAPALLAQMPAEALAERLQHMATILGGMEIERVDEGGPDALSLRALAYGYGFLIELAVETEPPHRLTRIDFGRWFAPPPGAKVAPWTPELASWEEAEHADGAPQDEIHALLADARERFRLMGLCVVVVHGGQIAYSLRSGPARMEPPAPVTSATLFMICSISKTMTALGVLQLWERGLLELDDPVNDHLRAFRIAHPDPAAPAVTIRHLLTHTSGAYAPVSLGFEVGAPTPSLAELYGGLLACQFPPGSRGSYSDHGFAALGQIVEDVSERPFAEYMRDNVFGPLRMDLADFTERVDDPALAVGYGGADGQLWEDRRFQAGPLAPAGSVTSNGEDMARYLMALVNGGANEHGRVVAAETLEAALTPQVETALPGFAMGLGFILTEIEGRRAVWHNGGWPGFSSTMWFAPDDGWGLVMLTNTSEVTGRGNDLDTVGREVLALLLRYEAVL